MIVPKTILISIIFFAIGCNNSQDGKAVSISNDSLPKKTTEEKQTFEIILDSIYDNKHYKIVQDYYSNGIGSDSSNSNTIFSFMMTENKKVEILYIDTVYSHTGEIEFKDFDGDNVKDILLQNLSDVRSNWTYNLYLVDTTQNQIRKVIGFEKIKNPNYLPENDLIDNTVMSGRNWTSFYKIQGDSIKDYGIVIYDNQNEDGNYDREYKKAIKTVLMKEKNNR